MTRPSLVTRANQCLSNVLSHATSLEIDHGHGIYLVDFNGQQYLDFGAGVAVNSTGHCHPDVVRAIQRQSETLLHGCAGIIYYPQNIELAEQIGQMTGGDLTSVFFTQSGTEAVEAALKCATYVRNRQGVVAFKGSFHGRTLGALSVTTSNQNYLKRYALAYRNPVVIDYPYYPHLPAPLNTESGYISYLKTTLASLTPDDLAAVIIEPFLGEGGYVPAPASVLKILRDWCNETGVLLIFDEVQSGMGRTGRWFYYHHHDVYPDIVTMAKGIASGLPLGACVSTPAIMNQWSTGSHGGTYSGNPLSCVAGTATISVISPLLPTIERLGNLALSMLQNGLGDHPLVSDIRGKGLMIGIEFATKDGSPNPDVVKAIQAACLDNHLLLVSCGQHRNVIRLMPPLIISESELISGLSTFISACQRM